MTCKACNGSRRIIATGRTLVARMCKACAAGCGCEDGWVYVEEDGYECVDHCPRCWPAREFVRRFNKARLPGKHDTTGIRPWKGPQAKVFRWLLKKWLPAYAPGVPGFTIWGPTGTGKTHGMIAAARSLVEDHGVDLRFASVADILEDVRQSYGDHGDAVLEAFWTVEVLCIDELHPPRTEWQLEVIGDIVEQRYRRGLTTLFTTNLILQQIEDGFRDRGPRIVRRLREWSPLIELGPRTERKAS